MEYASEKIALFLLIFYSLKHIFSNIFNYRKGSIAFAEIFSNLCFVFIMFVFRLILAIGILNWINCIVVYMLYPDEYPLLWKDPNFMFYNGYCDNSYSIYKINNNQIYIDCNYFVFSLILLMYHININPNKKIEVKAKIIEPTNAVDPVENKNDELTETINHYQDKLDKVSDNFKSRLEAILKQKHKIN